MPPARSKARKRALDVLFEAELRGLPVLELLAERITLGSPRCSDSNRRSSARLRALLRAATQARPR